MPRIDAQRYQDAYDQFFQGNLDPLRELTAEEYVAHVPSLDMTVSGREQAFEALRQVVQKMNIRSRLEKVEDHGDFLVGFVRGTSDVRGEFTGIDVVRWNEEGRIVEVYLHRNPLPPRADMPAD